MVAASAYRSYGQEQTAEILSVNAILCVRLPPKALGKDLLTALMTPLTAALNACQTHFEMQTAYADASLIGSWTKTPTELFFMTNSARVTATPTKVNVGLHVPPVLALILITV